MSTLQTRDASSIQSSTSVAWKRLWLMGLITLVASIAVNLIIRATGMAFVTIPAVFFQLQTPGPVIFFTIIGALGALLVFALMNRFSRNPIRLFRIVASVVFVVSFVPDFLLFSLPGTTVPAVIILMLMHVATFALCLALFTSPSRAKA